MLDSASPMTSSMTFLVRVLGSWSSSPPRTVLLALVAADKANLLDL